MSSKRELPAHFGDNPTVWVSVLGWKVTGLRCLGHYLEDKTWKPGCMVFLEPDHDVSSALVCPGCNQRVVLRDRSSQVPRESCVDLDREGGATTVRGVRWSLDWDGQRQHIHLVHTLGRHLCLTHTSRDQVAKKVIELTPVTIHEKGALGSNTTGQGEGELTHPLDPHKTLALSLSYNISGGASDSNNYWLRVGPSSFEPNKDGRRVTDDELEAITALHSKQLGPGANDSPMVTCPECRYSVGGLVCLEGEQPMLLPRNGFFERVWCAYVWSSPSKGRQGSAGADFGRGTVQCLCRADPQGSAMSAVEYEDRRGPPQN